MRIKTFRRIFQHLSFVTLYFGSKFGLAFGGSIPCLPCPFVGQCAGVCYLRRFQSEAAMSLGALFTASGYGALTGFLTFVLLIVIFGKSWCGWVCPFGLVQDWITGIREFFSIREARFSKRSDTILNYFKYFFLAWIVVPAQFIENSDFFRPFCAVCPVRTLMPPFFNGFSFSNVWTINMTNGVTFMFSFLLMFITGSVIVGMFFKKRFFCYFCPIAAFMHILKPLTLLRLVKEPSACHGCGTCKRKCTMGIDNTYQARTVTAVQGDGCCGCFGCVDTCSSGAIKIKFGPIPIYSSSRAHAASRPILQRVREFLAKKRHALPATNTQHSE